MSLLDDFLVRAFLAGLGVALAAAPLGCFVVWRRLAYFSDSTAHTAILGVAVALALDAPVLMGVLVMALAMAAFVSGMVGRSHTSDTLLGVLAHSALATGLVAVALGDGPRVDLSAYLFGDILAVSHTDLALIWGGAAMVIGLLAHRWSPLLTATLNDDLARAAGMNPRRERLVLSLALALTVSVALKVVGALLIGAMLLIPAAAARPFARSPEAMAVLATVIAGGASVGGMALSWHLDTPVGPTIVCTAAALFLASTLTALIRSRLAGL